MHLLKKIFKLQFLLALILQVCFIDTEDVHAQESWFFPSISVRGTYDDNVFLAKDKRHSDWITGVSPRLEFRPKLPKHKFMIDYAGDYNIFSTFNGQNNFNHSSTTDAELNFNKLHVNLWNRFRSFSDRAGSEDVNRVPRVQDHVKFYTTYNFPKVDFTSGYRCRFEYYMSKRAIGSFNDQNLTYKDADRIEQMGEMEVAAKVWPKTSILFSGDFGAVVHRTGKKPDSLFGDFLVGLRGKILDKIKAEAKIGYRNQQYQHYSDNYSNIIFEGSVIADFTPHDVLRVDFLRTTNETIYKDNAYYISTFAGATYKHGFTKKFSGEVFSTLQFDGYPTVTTEGDKTRNRMDTLWSSGCVFSYKMPIGFTLALRYAYLLRDSVFSKFSYYDNQIILSGTAEF
ncbi:MAG: outer membrane beta-barrel protein [Candidatus Omnitrophica bacterium]|nr:outer membrane beta-barrel protein [Candidatus Omnitrophota bacterium]